MLRSRCHIDSLELPRYPDFSSQYFKSYCTRLDCLSPVLERKIADQCGPDANIKKLCDIVPDEQCIVIGTIYKEMVGRPSVLKEFNEGQQQQLPTVLPARVVASANDKLFLEDSQQRIQLVYSGSEESVSTQVVSGVIAAVVGYEPDNSKGKFVVERLIYASPAWPQIIRANDDNARYIAIVSGLQLDGADDDDLGTVRVKLLFDWLLGLMEDAPNGDDAVEVSSVGRLIVAGDSLRQDCRDRAVSQNKLLVKKSEVNSAASLTLLDEKLSEVCRHLAVDLMSGPGDPTSVLMPQKPMHPVLFPRSGKWPMFHCRPNPWMFHLEDGGLVIGTAGQTIDDIHRYCDIADPLDRMAATVKWGHLTPTSPDTLPSYPNDDKVDPLMMPHRPSLYFAGNQDTFSWRNDHADPGTLLVTVPRFRETGQMVLVDLGQRRCRSLTFSPR